MDRKAIMYQAAKAMEWMRQFVKLPFARVITQFSAEEGNGYSCSFGQIEAETDTFASVLCGSIDIPEELEKVCENFEKGFSPYASFP